MKFTILVTTTLISLANLAIGTAVNHDVEHSFEKRDKVDPHAGDPKYAGTWLVDGVRYRHSYGTHGHYTEPAWELNVPQEGEPGWKDPNAPKTLPLPYMSAKKFIGWVTVIPTEPVKRQVRTTLTTVPTGV